MQHALSLAQMGRGHVSPNPMVGCVVVHNGRIIGEGYHQQYGLAHAEVNALAAVESPELLREATAYVTLEPCAHHGKTPPCAELLAGHQLKKVVIAALDSNPLVAGKGVGIMEKSGIEVVSGVLAEESRKLNSRFFTFIEKKRPFVLLKWAQTADGFLARENFDAKWISNALSRSLVHQWRAEEDAICVGANTAQYDNPQLNVRGWEGKNPVRIVIDRHKRLPASLHVFDGRIPTLVYNTQADEKTGNVTWVRLAAEDFLQHMLEDLYQRKIQSVLVEGGAAILNALIEAQLWDEARIFTSPQTFGRGIAAPLIQGKRIAQESIGTDRLEVFLPPH